MNSNSTDSAAPSEGLILDGLDKVKWADLQHAYGSAADVPGLLRDLASRDRERGEKALHQFYGNIWHQGTTYEATRYAVPFLRQILADPLTPWKEEILELLVSLAYGNSYHDVHQDLLLWEEERGKPGFQEQIERELSDVEAARQAVRAGVPQYLELWDAAAPAVRAHAIYLASTFGQSNPEVTSAREAKLNGETDPVARAALWIGWFYDAPSPDASARIEAAFSGINATPKWSLEKWALAALVLRYSASENTRDAAAQTMLDAMDEGEAAQREFALLPHYEEGLEAASLQQLLALSAAARAFAPQFCARLRQTRNQYSALWLLESLCPLFFGDFGEEKPVTWPALDENQRQIVRALAETDAVWGDPNVSFANLNMQLRYFGLPTERAAMAQLAQV